MRKFLTCFLLLAALAWPACAAPPGARAASPLVAALSGAATPPASQAAAPASEPLGESLDQVISNLQNDKQREALLDQLKAIRRGLSASGASGVPASAAQTGGAGLIGALAQAVDRIDSKLHAKDQGPWQYWQWRLNFAAQEWQDAVTQHGTRTALDSLREFGLVVGAWALAGWLLWELARRLRNRHLGPAAHTQLPALPSWVDVSVYMLRRIGPWVVAFVLTFLLAYRAFAHSPASVAAMLVSYSILAGALLSAACQVIFTLFRTAHRGNAIRDLLAHTPRLLYLGGALAALGNACTDGRVVNALGFNLAALLGTVADIAAALLIGYFCLRFRRPIGQLISNRPLAMRQAHPALIDVLRVAGSTWHLPVLAVVIASVIATLLATGHADDFLRRTVSSVALFVAALLLTLMSGRSPQAAQRPPRIRDQRRSAYVARFGKFALTLLRLMIWFGFFELTGHVWGVSLLELTESTELGKRIGEAVASVTGTVLLTWLLWLVIDTATTQLLSPTHGRAPQPSLRAKTILPLVRNALLVMLLTVALIVVLANLGVNVTPLLAGAGVVGLAIGFGAQSLVQDLITGLFIVIEDSIAIGDSIELPDHAGTVEAMTIRTVKLRDGKGALHVLPYSQIKIIKNLSRGYAYAVFSIAIAPDSDLDHALQLIRETGAEVFRDFRRTRKLMSGLDVLGLDQLGPNGPVVLAQFKTQPLVQGEITRAFNARLKRKFDANGIRLAAQQMFVRMAQPGQPAEAEARSGDTPAVAAAQQEPPASEGASGGRSRAARRSNKPAS